MRDAEQSVIGGILLDPKLISTAAEQLEPKMFADVDLAAIYGAMLRLHAEGKQPDIVTVLGAMGDGYKQLLTLCAETVPAMSAYEQYADAVLEAWRVRTLHGLAAELSYDNMTADEMTQRIGDVLAAQYALIAKKRKNAKKGFRDVLLKTYEQLLSRNTAIKTGWQAFDTVTGGLIRGGLYVIAARPGKGKTDFALQMAVTMAKTHSVSFQSLEMGDAELMQRILSRVLHINSVRLRDRDLSTEDFARINVVYERMGDLDIDIDDAGGQTISYIQQVAQTKKPDVLFVDYLGLVSGGNTTTKKAAWEITRDITHALKALAKKQGMAVVALAQLNREVDKKGGSASLADLAGGSSIEQDADGVFFLKVEAMDGAILSGNQSVICDVVVAKNRHGGTGTLPFSWQPHYHSYVPIETRREG